MSIRLLTSVLIAGVHYAVDGAVLSLSAGVEADLVGSGRALWVAPPGAMLPGAEHAAEHAALVLAGRRAMAPRNLIANNLAYALVAAASGGTITTTTPEPQSVVANCTATGATRLGMSKDITYDVTKFYEYSIEIEDFFFANQASVGGQLMGVGYTPASGTQSLTISSTPLVKGGRVAIRFQPGNAADYIRCGLNVQGGFNATAGDFIKFTRPAVYEVDGLAGGPIPYTWSLYGAVGLAPARTDSVGSCVLCCGDSWFNDATDPPGLLAKQYGREIVLSATGGHRLDNIATALNALIATGTAALNPSYRHVPGVAIIEGGINDLTADATGWTMWSRLLGILTTLRAKQIIPIVVLPTLPTDSAWSTVARRTAIDLYRRLVLTSGVAYLDGPLYFCNEDGTASTTYLTTDADKLHLQTAGMTLMARLLDEKIREVESLGLLNAGVATW